MRYATSERVSAEARRVRVCRGRWCSVASHTMPAHRPKPPGDDIALLTGTYRCEPRSVRGEDST